MRHINSLRIRVWLPICTLLILITLMATLVVVNYQSQAATLIEQKERQFVNILSSLARDAQNAIQTDNRVELERLFKTRTIDTQLSLLLGFSDSELVQFSSRTKHLNATASQVSSFFDSALLKKVQLVHKPVVDFKLKERHFIGYFPFALKSKDDEIRSTINGVIYGEYDLSLDFEHLRLEAFKKSMVILFFTCVILTFLALFIHRYILKNIVTLVDATLQVKDNELPPRLTIRGHGEFSLLAQNFNVMVDKIQTQIKHLSSAKAQSKEKHLLLEGFLNAIPDLFFVVNHDSTITQFHSSDWQSLYMQPSEFLNKKMTEVLPASVARQFAKTLNECIKSNNLIEFQYELNVAEGLRFFEARLSPINSFSKIAIVVRDITAQKHQEELIFKHAFYDSLTGLPNRYLVLERLSQMMVESKRTNAQIAIMFIDLDDFKKVNDSSGHEIGDKLLIEAAKRLSGALREQDTVARLGGDEFIILLKAIQDQSHVTPIANNLVRLFQSPFCIDNKEFSVSLSLGIAMFPSDASTPHELLSKADSAMYNAKQQGRNTFSFYTEQMSERLARRLQIESLMQGALARNEFEVYFQPQINLHSGQLLGAEALVRWHNDTLGFISPAEFIPIAEQNGSIVELGKFVFETALTQAREWQAQTDMPLRIAVNLSPRQFRDVRLISDLKRLMDSNISPHVQIELEITEGLLLSGDEKIKSTLYALHELGFILSMDDFGTGYSSLSYLRLYPFDVLKIDKAFVQDMDHPEGLALVTAIISMAHSLGLKVVAEGIETERQREQLHHLECDIGQGFLLGRPVAAEEFSKYIDKEPKHKTTRVAN